MTKYIIAGLLALCLALGGYGWYSHSALQSSKAKVATLTESNRILTEKVERDARVIKNHARKQAELAKKEADRAKELPPILEQERDWAEQPVPPAVLDWLRDDVDPRPAP